MKNFFKDKKIRYEYLLLMILIIFISTANILWILKDNRSQPFFDQYPYRTLNYYDKVTNEPNLRKFIFQTYKLGIGPRAPLYQMLAVPNLYFFGRSMDSMLFSNVLILFILLVSTYGIGKEVKNTSTGLLAALIVTTYPPVTILTKHFLPHNAALAFSALSLWLLFRFINRPSIKSCWLFLISLSLSLLAHPNVLYALILPLAIITIYVFLFRIKPNVVEYKNNLIRFIVLKTKTPLFYKGLLPAGIIAFLPTAIWYYIKYDKVQALIYRSETYWYKISFGFREIPISFWWYLKTSPGVLSTIMVALLGISLLYNLVKRRENSFLLTIILLLMYFSQSYLKAGAVGWKYFVAILPACAVVTAVFVVDFLETGLRSKTKYYLIKIASIAVFLTCIFASLLNYTIVSFDFPKMNQSTLNLLRSPITSSCNWPIALGFCPYPAVKEHWSDSADKIIRYLHELPDCKTKECNLTLINSSGGRLSYSGLRYKLLEDFPEYKIKISKIKTSERSGPNSDWLTAQYLLSVPKLDNYFYSYAVNFLIENKQNPFSESLKLIEHFKFPDNYNAKLYKRVRNLNTQQSIDSINMLQIPDDLKNKLVKELDN